MEQKWFDLDEYKKDRLSNAVWIPLRSSQKIKIEGQYGFIGFIEEFYGLGSIAVPIKLKEDIRKNDYSVIGVPDKHNSYFQDGKYYESDKCVSESGDFLGVPLVLDQELFCEEPDVWHLHQDLVIALDLIREDDKWLCPYEGYTEVVRLKKGPKKEPILLDIRREFLIDYLCARNFGLYITSYRGRKEVVEDTSNIKWNKENNVEETNDYYWEGRIIPIHEGGVLYNSKVNVLHASRTDVDPLDEVPKLDFPTNNVKTEKLLLSSKGRKLYLVDGELWRKDWIDPGMYSPKIRRDSIPGSVPFIVDANGNREVKETLKDGSRWLWFRPEVINQILRYRGSKLNWYTKYTGSVKISPQNGVSFGINDSGLVNVYAKDIGELPDWQQRIWSGFNISPEGGVSSELLDSQMKSQPANTTAPEMLIIKNCELLQKAFLEKTGNILFRKNNAIGNLKRRIHRFHSVDENGLFSLSKDIVCLIIESIEIKSLKTDIKPPKGAKWGSLKYLENFLSKRILKEEAYNLLSPLHGVYNLRNRDSHLSGNDKEKIEAYKLIGLDSSKGFIFQGMMLIENTVNTLKKICEVISAF